MVHKSLIKDYLIYLLQILTLLFFLSAYYDTNALLIIGGILFLVQFFWFQKQYFLIFLNFYFLMFPTGLYLSVGFTRPNNLLLAAVYLLFLHAISYLFINFVKNLQLSILILIGTLLIILYPYFPTGDIHLFIKIAIIFWAYNFFLLIKEADKNQRKNILHSLTTLNAFWNYPAFLNITYTFLKEHEIKVLSEMKAIRINSLVSLAKTTPLFIINNYVGFVLLNHTLGISDFQSQVFRLYYSSPAFDAITQLNLVTSDGLNFLLGILGGGLIYISFLVYVNVTTTAFLAFLGYQIPYKGLEVKSLTSFSRFINQVFYFYNHTLIYVFYNRFHFFTKKFMQRLVPFLNKYKIFPTLIFGGIVINMMTDLVVMHHYFSISQIVYNSLWLFPYFTVLAATNYISSSVKAYKLHSTFLLVLRIIFYWILLSLIFSLGRLVFIKKGFSQFIEIYRKIFMDLYNLISNSLF